MGIGRRQFFKFVGAALAGASTHPAAAVAVNNNYYVNRKLGLGFMKPDNWYFESFKDFGYLQEGHVYSEKFNKIMEELGETLTEPLAVMSKYPLAEADKRIFGPSISIYFGDDKELENYESYDLYLQDAIDGWKLMFHEFEVMESPSELVISKCQAWRFKAKALYEYAGIEPFWIDMETYLFRVDGGEYNIHCFDSPYTGEPSMGCFKDFISSLRIL